MSSKYRFKASPTSMGKDMPYFNTKFVLTFILPDVLKQKYGAEILTEAVKSIDGLDLDKFPDMVEQMYHGIKRRFGGTVADTAVDLEMIFEVNVTKAGRIYPLDLLRDWGRLVYNSEGVVLTKEEYCGSCVIEVTNVKDEVLRRVNIPIIFPAAQINEKELNYNEEGIYELTFKFAAEDCEDVYIG